MDATKTESKFQIASGSVAGRDHVNAGKNNQDAAFWLETESATVLLVCDGCSSGEHSEVGAWIGARIVTHAVAESVKRHSANLLAEEPQRVLEDARLAALDRLREVPRLTRMHGIQELLFTIVGALITPETTVLFSIGDGVVAVNDEVIVIGPFAGNAPPYLAYGLDENDGKAPRFEILRTLKTDDVTSLLVGTDGAADLVRLAEQTLPGCCETVGRVEQFWREDRYFKNVDMLRRRLALINRCNVVADWERRSIERQVGLLRDDTTLIVAKRHRIAGAMCATGSLAVGCPCGSRNTPGIVEERLPDLLNDVSESTRAANGKAARGTHDNAAREKGGSHESLH